MKFTQYYLDCLSQASYLIGDETTGRAVVVDPRRDIDEYVRDAAADGLTIELVIETHFHADFLSGHLELAAATGAEFALLPPQNATGNWVKVVQRIPVRLRIEPQADVPRLRAGMTVTVEVDTRHQRDWPLPFGNELGDAWRNSAADM